ncbi:hypothetical protein [Hungatella sp.]|jgi:hypothetical protein|uniref:hypothetical protein n=1 Tax=Hungatella sp. TaxID=2613924 RepID=UPI002A7F1272|nr:hypothetical protein [Hungatella sp.]
MSDILLTLRNLLVSLANALLKILPTSPFQLYIEKIADIPALGYLNYFFPIGEMIVVTEAWLAAILIFYAYQLVLRWIKLIG